MENLDFHKTKPGVVDVDFKAWNIQLHGLHNIKVNFSIDKIVPHEYHKIVPHSASQVKNLHVLRHMGLQDLRLVIQVIYNRISSYNNRNKSKGKPWIENKDNRLMKK